MGKENKNLKEQADNETVVGIVKPVDEDLKELVIPSNAVIDVQVTVISKEKDPFHKTGEKFKMAKKTAELKEEAGWVEIVKEEKKK